MPIADVYMLQMFQTNGAGGEMLLNNFFYERQTAGGSAADLIVAFQNAGLLWDEWKTAQLSQIKHTRRTAICLGSLTDFADSIEADAGVGATGEMLPIHDAVNFTLRLDTRAVRPGSKRLSGLSEAHQSGGIVTDATYIGYLNDIVAGLSATLTGDDDSYKPVVVKRIYEAPDLTHPRARYRLPETTGELVLGHVTGALVNLRISHQTSRGNGR